MVISLIVVLSVFFMNSNMNEPFLNNPDTISKLVSAYVINLERNKERLNHFRKSYESADLGNLIPCNRFEAIDGNTVPVQKYVTPEIFTGIKEIDATNRRTSMGQLTRGMIGCYLSHLAVYDLALQSSAKYALVFEDDASIASDIYGSAIDKILRGDRNVPHDWDIMLLGVICNDCHEYNGEYNVVDDFFGLHGYLINRRAMELMKTTLPIETQIDIRMSILCREQKLKIYSVIPTKVGAGDFGTDLQMRIEQTK